jgi:hypothetical protein
VKECEDPYVARIEHAPMATHLALLDECVWPLSLCSYAYTLIPLALVIVKECSGLGERQVSRQRACAWMSVGEEV